MFYAYFLVNTKDKGIVDSWSECEQIVKGKNAKFKKFSSIEEANYWLNNDFNTNDNNKLIKDAIYFDAGTGRGIGVEVRVTDVNKNSLLSSIIPKNLINSFQNYQLSKNRTNNFGELVGLYFALKYALKNNIKTICGDSKLVIEYWVNLRYNAENIDEDTIELIHKTNKLYLKFKENQGKLIKISGDINPADLGFHK